MTYLFLVINSLVLLAMFASYGFLQYDSVEAVYQFGGLVGVIVKELPLTSWRLFSAIFVHIGLMHFASNMLSLYLFGRLVEGLYGSWRFFLIYLMSGLMGNLFVLFFDPRSLSAGASTALFGLMAVLVSQKFLSKIPQLQHLGQQFTGLLVVNICISFLPGVSLFGHLGGLLGGLLTALIFPLPFYKASKKDYKPALVLTLYLALALALYFL